MMGLIAVTRLEVVIIMIEIVIAVTELIGPLIATVLNMPHSLLATEVRRHSPTYTLVAYFSSNLSYAYPQMLSTLLMPPSAPLPYLGAVAEIPLPLLLPVVDRPPVDIHILVRLQVRRQVVHRQGVGAEVEVQGGM